MKNNNYIEFDGTKVIVKVVDTGRNKYFACDIKDVLGKKKRIYGATMSELQEKLDKIAVDKERVLSWQKPTDKSFFEYTKFYLKNASGASLHSKVAARLLAVSEDIIKGSIIDKPIKEITKEELNIFLDEVFDIWKKESVCVLNIVQKTYELAAKLGDIDQVFLSDNIENITFSKKD